MQYFMRKTHVGKMLIFAINISCIHAFFGYISDLDDEEKVPFVWSLKQIYHRVTNHQCECGILHVNEKNPFEPWTISIFFEETDMEMTKLGAPNCTGSIISDKFILTSASCLLHTQSLSMLEIINTKQIKLPKVAAYWINAINKTETLKLEIENIILHTGYILELVSSRLRYDAALLLLKKRMDFSNSAKQAPSCLPTWSGQYKFGHRPILKSTASISHTSKSFSRKILALHFNNLSICSDFSSIKSDAGMFCKLLGNDYYDEKLFGKFLKNGLQSNLGMAFYISPSPYTDSGAATDKLKMVQVGIGSYSDKMAGSGKVPAEFLFATIIPDVIDFIDYQSLKHNAIWCKQHNLRDGVALPESSRMFQAWKLYNSNFRDTSLPCECGAGEFRSDFARIIGGKRARVNQFPWMALIKLIDRNVNKKVICTGSIINNRLVLTAAHCLFKLDRLPEKETFRSEDINVYLETLKMFSRNEANEVRNFYIHPKTNVWDSRKFPQYDLALLELKHPLTFDDNYHKLSPLCIPTSFNPVNTDISDVLAAGWGSIRVGSSAVSSHLMYLDHMNILGGKSCSKRFHRYFRIPENVLCDEDVDQEKDTGVGDSGGPLFYMNTEGKAIQIGLTSAGIPFKSSGRNYSLSAYTSIQDENILPFIEYVSVRSGAKWCKQPATIKNYYEGY